MMYETDICNKLISGTLRIKESYLPWLSAGKKANYQKWAKSPLS